MRKLSKLEESAIIAYEQSKIVQSKTDDILEYAFSGYKYFMKNGDFDAARKFLEPMPDCDHKILIFREISIIEDNMVQQK